MLTIVLFKHVHIVDKVPYKDTTNNILPVISKNDQYLYTY